MLLDLNGGGGGGAPLFTSEYCGGSRSLPGLSSKGGDAGGRFAGGGGKSMSQPSESSSNTAGGGGDGFSANSEFKFFPGFFSEGGGSGGGGGGGGTRVTKPCEKEVFSGALNNDPVDGGIIDGSCVVEETVFGIVKFFVFDSSSSKSPVAGRDV